MDTELIIQNGKTVYSPAVEEGIEWSTERHGTPGKLTFKVLDDAKLKITEGNPVRFKYKNKKIFYGFIFTRKISDGVMTVTAYDQLRYLKNKDSYVYANRTMTWLVKKIASDFSLKKGTLVDTKYKIPSRVEDDKSLFDMIESAHDLTLINTGEMYVLYDDFGKLTLKNLEKMKVQIVIDQETCQTCEFSSSIDKDVYNQVKVYYDNKDTGKREIYIAKSGKNINAWGVLQSYEKLEDGENGKKKANMLLKMYNVKTQNLSIKDAVGDYRVRGGSMVVVSMKIDHSKILKWMIVEKCKHTFKDGEHWMDLTLRGGDFTV
jgi:hypothetical protein